MLEKSHKNESKILEIAKYISNCFCVINILFLPFLFIFNLLFLGASEEVGEYIASFYINVIDLIILLVSLKVFNYASNKDFTFISINIIWFIIEIIISLLAIDFYFIEGPNVHIIIESIYDSERFAHDKSKAYLYLLGILIAQTLKIFLTSKEIIFYFRKNKKYLNNKTG